MPLPESLLLVGLTAGLVAMLYGYNVVSKKKAKLIPGKTLTGTPAVLAGGACMFVGVAFITFLLVFAYHFLREG